MKRQKLPATNAMFQGERAAEINTHGLPPPAAVHNCYKEKGTMLLSRRTGKLTWMSFTRQTDSATFKRM